MKKLVIFLYFVFLISFSIFSYVFVDSNFSYLKALYSGFAFSNRLLTTIFYISFILIFFIFYSIFVFCEFKKKSNPNDIFLLIGVTTGALLFSYPAMLSYDIFNYIATSKVLFFYHENPYVVMPIEFIGDPILSFTHAANKIALYGPFWTVLTGIPYFLGFGNFIITLFSFKFLVGAFYLATTLLVWKISKNTISTSLFAFNPLIVIETLISGHNDIVMIFLTLLSFFLLMRRKIFPAILFFILSILIKYASILLIPIFLYALWKITKRGEINWQIVFYFSALSMYVGFLLSPIREEIYPWYAIWFLSFAFLVPYKKILLFTSIAFSLSLLLRYTPYMLSGTYSGQTPVMKEVISFIFPAVVNIYYVLKKKI